MIRLLLLFHACAHKLDFNYQNWLMEARIRALVIPLTLISMSGCVCTVHAEQIHNVIVFVSIECFA